MRLLFILGLILYTMCAEVSANNNVFDSKGVVVVLDDQSGRINLDHKLHEIAKDSEYISVIDLNSYKKDYYQKNNIEEVREKIKEKFPSSTIMFVRSSAYMCDYDVYRSHDISSLNPVTNYLNALGCNLDYSPEVGQERTQKSSTQEAFSASLIELPVVYFQIAEREDEKLNTTVTASLVRKGAPEELTSASEVVVYSYPITAEENVDYIPFSKVVRFEAGQTRILFTFELLESDGERDEFGVGLRYPVNAQISEDPQLSNKLIVNLYSNTLKDYFTIETPGLAFYSEGEEYALTLTRANKEQEQSVEYNYDLVGIGSEFSFSQTNFVFTPGVASIELKFKVNDDFKFNAEQRFVNFSFKETAKAIFPNGSTASFPIGDSRRAERGTFGFEFSRYVLSNNSDDLHVKIIRKAAVKSTASFIVTAKDVGSAYTSEQIVAFEDGQTEADVSLVDIPKNNSTIELDLLPQVDVELSTSSAEVRFVNLADETVMLDKVTFPSAGHEVAEGTEALTLPLKRSGTLDYVGAVQVEVIGGTAVEGVDYSIKNKSLTYGLDVESQDLVIEIVNDDVFKGDRSIQLKVTSTNMRVPSPQIDISLKDNDYDKLGIIGFKVSTIKADEEQQRVALYINRSVAGPAVEFNVEAVDETAKAGVDYEWSGTRIVRFDEGSTETVIFINMIGNSVPDFDKTFSLKLTSPEPIKFGANQIRVTIEDNEKNNAVYVKVTGSLVVANAGAASSISTAADDKLVKLTLTRSGRADEAFRLFVKSVDGSAKSGINYTEVNESYLFGSGELTKEITIAIRKSSITGSYSDFTLHMTADTANFVVENPALQVKITPTTVVVAPGGNESSGGSMSGFMVALMCSAFVFRRRVSINTVRGLVR